MIDKITNTSSKGKVLSLCTFFFLYIAQSIPSSFLTTALQVMMREAQFSLSTIGLLQLVKLPWIVKFLWSPLVDRHCVTLADYKRCIISSELVYALILLAVGFMHIQTDLYLILILVILSLCASATQDIATDALAVLSFSKRDHSLVNSMQSMGSFGGALIGGGVLLMILHTWGWRVVIICLALFVLLALLPLLFNHQLKITPKEPKQRARLSDFALFFTQGKKIWKQIGFLILYYTSIIGILSMLRPWLVDCGYTMKEIGMLSGIIGTSMAFVASFGAGWLVRNIGCHKARILFAVFILFTTLYFLSLSWTGVNTITLVIGIILLWSSYGMATIVVYTTSMQCVRKGREGTDFTVQTVLTHLSGMIIAVLSGTVAEHLGYHGLFALEAVVATCSLFYILWVFKGEKDFTDIPVQD